MPVSKPNVAPHIPKEMRRGAEQEGIKASRRVAGKIHAPACVLAFIHDGKLPSRTREFQRPGLLGIAHGRGFGLFFGFGIDFR
jgi:hypothetical protein